MSTASATAVAHPNLALIKYWGKRDETLVLPHTGSLSLTLDVFPTRTSVAADETLEADVFVLNGTEQAGVPAERVVRFLDLVRERAGSTVKARVTSENSVPTGAGLASSASGFAALALAASAAYGLPTDPASVSRLARRGSGSACRSVLGDLVVWRDGKDAEDPDAASVAESVPGPDLAMVIAVVSAEQKAVSSRTAMRETVATSPYFEGWVSSTTRDLQDMIGALAAGDVEAVGALTESNALRMHAAINGNRPPVRYLSPTSVALFDAVERLRRDGDGTSPGEGIGAWATADAGPNVAVLCRDADLERVTAALAAQFPGLELIPARSGPGTHLVDGAAATASGGNAPEEAVRA